MPERVSQTEQRGRRRTGDAAIVRVVAGLDLQPRFEHVQRAHEHCSDGASHAARHTVDHHRVIQLLALRVQRPNQEAICLYGYVQKSCAEFTGLVRKRAGW